MGGKQCDVSVNIRKEKAYLWDLDSSDGYFGTYPLRKMT